jgi:hypothetical protein
MKAQVIAAAGLLFALRAHGQDTIYSGTGFGTYYYDVEQVQACGADFSAQDTGQLECSLTQVLTLDMVNSNYVVAMNHTQLVGDMATYCGKKVIVSVNGQPSDLPLFIGDGCERCGTGSSSSTIWDPNGAPGLDFSYSVLSELSSSACAAGHIDLSWEIVDETLYNFDTTGAGTPQGPVTAPVPSIATQPSKTSVSGPTSVNTGVINPVVPTTLVTVTRTTIVSPTDPSDPGQGGTPTNSNPSGACSTGAWQCNGNVLEQCLVGNWMPRTTCQASMTCQGGANPYCAPPGFGQLAPPTRT